MLFETGPSATQGNEIGADAKLRRGRRADRTCAALYIAIRSDESRLHSAADLMLPRGCAGRCMV